MNAVTVARFALEVSMRDHGLCMSSVLRCLLSLAFCWSKEFFFIVVVHLHADRPSQPHLVAADDALQRLLTCMKIKAYEAQVSVFRNAKVLVKLYGRLSRF